MDEWQPGDGDTQWFESLYPDILTPPSPPSFQEEPLNQTNYSSTSNPEPKKSNTQDELKEQALEEKNQHNNPQQPSVSHPDGNQPSGSHSQFGPPVTYDQHSRPPPSHASNLNQIHMMANSASLASRRANPPPNPQQNSRNSNTNIPPAGSQPQQQSFRNSIPNGFAYNNYPDVPGSPNPNGGNMHHGTNIPIPPQSNQPTQDMGGKTSNYRPGNSAMGRIASASGTHFHPYSPVHGRSKSSQYYPRPNNPPPPPPNPTSNPNPNPSHPKMNYNNSGSRPTNPGRSSASSTMMTSSAGTTGNSQNPQSIGQPNNPNMYSRGPQQPGPVHFTNPSGQITAQPANPADSKQFRSSYQGYPTPNPTNPSNAPEGDPQNTNQNPPMRTPKYHQNQLSSFMPNSTSFHTIYSRSQNALFLQHSNYASCRYISMSAPLYTSPYYGPPPQQDGLQQQQPNNSMPPVQTNMQSRGQPWPANPNSFKGE